VRGVVFVFAGIVGRVGRIGGGRVVPVGVRGHRVHGAARRGRELQPHEAEQCQDPAREAILVAAEPMQHGHGYADPLDMPRR